MADIDMQPPVNKFSAIDIEQSFIMKHLGMRTLTFLPAP